MAATQESNKDKEMAAYMKAKGIDRHTGRCPICHGLVSVNRQARQAIVAGMYTHIITCHGRRSSGEVERLHRRRESTASQSA